MHINVMCGLLRSTSHNIISLVPKAMSRAGAVNEKLLCCQILIGKGSALSASLWLTEVMVLLAFSFAAYKSVNVPINLYQSLSID